jgi:transposase
LVTRQGFPLGYEIFAGNTFEGKTMIPVLESFAKRYRIQTPTVVADAAMLSHANIAELKKRNLSYIVGARLANASPSVITQVSNVLNQQDGAIVRTPTKHGDLVASFSSQRYRKNKGDMERQIERAKMLVEYNEPGRRAKFVTKDNGDIYALNEHLIEKTKKLLGIRGYYTDISENKLPNSEVITRYHDLWHVENAFRMAKGDLAARPIFHHKEDAIKTHILICFTALVIGKYVELRTGVSNRAMRDILWSVTDAHMVDTATEETFTFRSPVYEDTKAFLRKLGVSY